MREGRSYQIASKRCGKQYEKSDESCLDHAEDFRSLVAEGEELERGIRCTMAQDVGLKDTQRDQLTVLIKEWERSSI